MIFFAAVCVAMFCGVVKWVMAIVEAMRNRCQDSGYRIGAIVSNVCYFVVSAFVWMLCNNVGVSMLTYVVLAWLGNTVFCLCTTAVSNGQVKHDNSNDDDYGYIGH